VQLSFLSAEQNSFDRQPLALRLAIIAFKFLPRRHKMAFAKISSPLNVIGFVTASALTLLTPLEAFAHGDEGSPEAENSDSAPMGHHVLTHPFLTHMGLPDGPGESSVRLTHIQRAGETGSGSDAAIHIEAGIAERFGLHLRNDAINGAAMGAPGEPMEDHGTELMLMYSLFQDKEATRGLSIFAETSWPTVRGTGPGVRGAGGMGGRWMWGTRVGFDVDFHLDPSSGPLEGEYEATLQGRVAGRIFLLLETRGNFIGSGPKQNYVLPAVKVGLGKTAATAGVGVQLATTNARDYDRQTMFQLDYAF
jgi:hypothetical protein